MKHLKDKTVIITGASSGIGRSTALRLAQAGANLVLAARRKDKLNEVLQKVQELDCRAISVKSDVTKKEDIKNLFSKTIETFSRVDILINNAGIAPISPFEKLEVSSWDKMIDVNIKGVLYGVAEALPIFKKQQSGHIVNISSVAGRRVYQGGAVYCATKFAVRVISEGLRQEINPKDNIKVSVIEPGMVNTNLLDSVTDEETRKNLKENFQSFQALEPEDVAESIFYALTQADRVNVDEILIMPREQGH